MFTENQSRQLYVVTAFNGNLATSTELSPVTTVTNASSAGTTVMGETKEQEFFFIHKGATDDGLQRSDLINKCHIMDIRATAADDMAHKMSKYEVTLNSTPIAGQAYILNIIVKNYIANGDDSIKVKFGAAKALTTTASDLYKNLAMNVAKNFSREAVKLLKVTLEGDNNHTEITNKTKFADLNSITATGIILEEVEQPWRLGAAKQEFVNLEVIPSTVFDGSNDVVWGTVTDITANNTNVLPNSKKIADMEYFYHKNRGDVYGMQCWPCNIDTKYMVNPADTNGYSTVDIHYYYEGNSHNVGHSEKTITLVGAQAVMTTLLSALESSLNGYNVNVVKSANWPSGN